MALDQPATIVDELARLLAVDEGERAGRFHFPRDRRRYIVARGALRRLLGNYTAVPPARITFQYNRHGKPFLDGDAPSFNVAHSGELALIAVTTPGRAVGVDLEQKRDRPNIAGIARRFFSPAERERLLALPAAAQPDAFYHVWACKEAYIKAEGVGLGLGLGNFDVNADPGQPAGLLATRPDAARAAQWTMTAVPIDPGYAAALVAAGHPLHLRLWRWQP